MGRVNNETNLIVAVLKEKAKARKELLVRIGKSKESINDNAFVEKGINWTLTTLDGILKTEIIDK